MISYYASQKFCFQIATIVYISDGKYSHGLGRSVLLAMREGSKSPAMYQKHMVQALGACAYRSIDEHWPLKTALCYQINSHIVFKYIL